ncbi:helix-turn-helix domain-containing protein [Actinopolyspora halophila]|uniref:helix-turn-helix domain-containing protein n=1 Tax=Actinopolyspora halophila TaxID=1850 RepID=UPI000687F61F|nr:helix-turn-helix transcriptional regulator [Actinopolyspora halophila]
MSGDVERHSPQARLLGAELRELRKEAGMTVRELAKRVDLGHAAVSRYETGVRSPARELLARILTALGASGERYEEMMELQRRASEPNLIADSRSGLHKHLLNLAEFERTANHIVHVAPMVIPGPLQTRDYAEQIMSGLTGEERELRVELRMARSNEVLVSGKLDAIICEGVLHDDIGGPQVLNEQIKHLIATARNQQARIRILPSRMQRWTLAHNGSFVLFEFPKASPIVHLEHYRGPAFIYDQKDVEAYRKALTTLTDSVMSEGESVELMAAVAARLEGSIQHDGSKGLEEV